MDRSLIRELAAECLGTFLLIAFGVGSVAQMVLSHHTLGTTLSVNIGWGLAVMLGAYASAGVSGAHLNPAVTLAFAAYRGFPWRKVVPYAIAQLLGAFLASAVVYVTYREALDAFDGGLRAVSGRPRRPASGRRIRNLPVASPAASSIKWSAPRCS